MVAAGWFRINRDKTLSLQKILLKGRLFMESLPGIIGRGCLGRSGAG